MATAPANAFLILPNGSENTETRSSALIRESASNELVFAVVGHAGAGTTAIANALSAILSVTTVEGKPFEVEILKARTVIREWALEQGETLPPDRTGGPLLEDVRVLQDFGDKMRSQEIAPGVVDHSAVARALLRKIRAARGTFQNVAVVAGEAVVPNGNPRAFIIDSVRHPAEVELFRHLYQDAFVLVGVVCGEVKRIDRITAKYRNAGRVDAHDFMERDAGAKEKHGQQVAKAFHLSDFFVDNTQDRNFADGRSNDEWRVNEHLSRLVKILLRTHLVRPTIAETAMHHASSAQLRSACLSRQVGAALVDAQGNIVATGTNEAPRPGGGVYGEGFARNVPDYRCGMMEGEQRFCRNTQEQIKIIKKLIADVAELKATNEARKAQLIQELQSSPIGSLIEFSRAIHAEMDAILSAGRKGVSLLGTRLFVTTFPCHYCARHIVSAGIDEVQYIEPYPKSRALDLHRDAIQVEETDWQPPSAMKPEANSKVLFRPFSGVSPRFYKKAFLKERELKNSATGKMEISSSEWGEPWHLGKMSYPDMEVELSNGR